MGLAAAGGRAAADAGRGPRWGWRPGLRVGRDGVYRAHLFNAGARLSRAEFQIVLAGANAQAPAPTPDQTAFRAIYKELVETNTSLSVGSCTLAAVPLRAFWKMRSASVSLTKLAWQ